VKRALLIAALASCVGARVGGHVRGTTPITWNREISRLIYAKCAVCHRPGGTAFSLMTYQEVQPRLVAIKEAVLSRQMPPWGAVSGFGEFRNDQSLTQEQLELITDWIEDDAPKGNNPNVLPKEPKFDKQPTFKSPKNGISLKGDLALSSRLTLDGVWLDWISPGESPQIVAEIPDGQIEPLLWVHEYRDDQRHPFLFRKPVDLPPGTVIRSSSPDARVVLIPARNDRRRNSAK
jgi:hypothetical protein